MRKIQLAGLADKIYTKLRKQSINKLLSTMKKLSSCHYIKNSYKHLRARYLFEFFPDIKKHGRKRNRAAFVI
jgi:hypothetical protein